MLTVLAHPGRPAAPHDLWAAWNLDPLLLAALLGAGVLYARGRAAAHRPVLGSTRARCFAGALLVIAVALVSPLDAASGSLASAHMVQHVLLMLVAAPLLSLSSPLATLLRGGPPALSRAAGSWHRRLRTGLKPLRRPAPVWLLHVGTIWFWHASVPYGAALASEAVHIVEHVTFLVTAVLFWNLVLGGARAGKVSKGLGILLVFGAALQSVFLSALLTFARTPWYRGYLTTTQAWGLGPLEDQQLAGVLMWVPAGAVYASVALTLLVLWIRASEAEPPQLPIRPMRTW